ncbi:TIGR03086 family metal-binding protein [Streptomyces sp. NBC_00448]|uniref:TIGR03086 family metal-binding protein n=1 Tax=Streptomyces sp. NBC_00448 TaxID=2903652 RepID=UPI002E221728
MTDDAVRKVDLGPAAARVAALAEGIGDERLAAPTPCPDTAVRNLLGHVIGLSQGFGAAGRKELGAATSTPPFTSVPDIDDEGAWRAELPAALDELAAAWREPAAWTEMTQVGGVTLPAAQAGVVALNELVVHGWDLARATGQDYQPTPEELATCRDFLAPSAADRPAGGPFGPALPFPPTAPLLDQLIALSGRSPSWRP